MSEGQVKANGIDIWYETFGSSDDPTIILIMGLGAQGIRWDREFCERLVAGGRQVVRFDNRDVGLSQWFGDEEPYDLGDMAADVIGLMDALGIGRAHVAGASMGGMISQILAIRHPGRVLTLTSIISTPAKPRDPAVEPGDPSVMEALMALSQLRPDTREEKIEAGLHLQRLLTGSRFPFDEARWRARIGEVVDRAWYPEGRAHHLAAVERTPSWSEDLRNVSAPALIIQATQDPFFPVSHAQRMADLIPDAAILWLEGVGHELPPGCWDQVIPALLEHTSRTAAIV